MERATKTFKALVVLSVIFVLISCNPLENESDSNTLLLVVQVTGTDMGGNTVNFLQSDVLYVDSSTGTETIFADSATATLKAVLLNPDPLAVSSVYNDVQLTSYAVSYFRSDGKNREGVDVPFSFSGQMSAYIEVDSTASVSFVIVREVAKAEPPLVELREGGGAGVIQATARIDFYGQDVSRHKVQATGYLTIFFANYANE